MERSVWFALAIALCMAADNLHAQGNCSGAACSPVAMTDALDPLELEQADLAINLAHSLAREKRYAEALQSYREFLRIFSMSPRMREARESMARIYEKRQRYDLAIEQYNALYRELGISQPGLLYRLEAARLLEMSGDEQAAATVYREINQLDPASEAAARARVRVEALNLLQKSGSTETDQLVKSSPQNE